MSSRKNKTQRFAAMVHTGPWHIAQGLSGELPEIFLKRFKQQATSNKPQACHNLVDNDNETTKGKNECIKKLLRESKNIAETQL